MSYNTLWQKMSLQYIDAIKKASGSDYFPLMYLTEFDDALVDAAHWKNPRWAGCKLTGFKINEYHGTHELIDKINTSSADYLGQMVSIPTGSDGTHPYHQKVWGGDISYGLNPVINKETTAIYIANTVVGGTENPSYATLEGHSYVGISKILVVNKEDNTVKVIDRETEPYESFHRFITSDFPTGAKLNIKVLDESVQSNLEGNYSCRMNKGWLLSTFKYLDYLNDNGINLYGSGLNHDTWDNPLELFDNSDMGDTGNDFDGFAPDSSTIINNQVVLDTNRLSFRFGYKADDTSVGQDLTGNTSNTWNVGVSGVTLIANRDFSPNYTGATIETNKFTKQYYTGSNTFPSINTEGDGAFFSASRFILNDTMDFLVKNFETTELHLTLNKGTKDFAPGFNDERSMGTFEVDRGYGDVSFLGKNNHLNGFSGLSADGTTMVHGDFVGHNTPFHHIIQLKGGTTYTPTGEGFYQTEDHCLLLENNQDSQCIKVDHTRRTFWNGDEDPLLQYSGSSVFELSFLDKDHTLIVNVNKDEELFDGIGTKGVALIPEYLHETIKGNLEYYLKQGGILEKSPVFHPKK